MSDKLDAHEAHHRDRARELFGNLEDFFGDPLKLAKLLQQLQWHLWEAGLGKRLEQMLAEVSGRYDTPAYFATLHIAHARTPATLTAEQLAESLASECLRVVKPNGPDTEYFTEMQIHWARMSRDLLGLDQQRYGPDPDREGIVYWDEAPCTVTPTSWQFLHAIWGRYDVPFAEIGEAVWDSDVMPKSTIRARAHNASRELSRHGIDLKFSCAGEKVSPRSKWPE